ncbi:MAG: putative Zn-dependent peptidase [Roseivirga sp.]|jgi:predicted Zn-dependent peptidase
MQKQILSLFLASFVGSATAQSKIEFEEYDLDNGLHVILHEDHSTPIVAVSVLYHVGSKNEKQGRSGFAHFFEHLMFEGSPHIERGEYMKIVSANGGALNANTSFDRTFYYEILPSNQLELGLWLESERMLQAKVDIVGVNTQREVVKEEKRLRVDNQPYGSFQGEMFGAAFKDSYYAITPIGTMEDLNAAEEADFKDFYSTFYVPNNATLSIAGDIDPEQAKAWIAKYFSTIPTGTKEIPRPTEKLAPLTGEVVDTIYDNIQLPGIFMGYRCPERGSRDAYAMDMLSTILADGQSSMLYKSIVDEKQLGVVIQAFNFSLENGGLFITFGLANPDTEISDFIQAVDDEINKLITEGISEEDYTKIQNQIENDFVSTNGSVAGIAESLADNHVYLGDANLINTEITNYREITADYLQEVAAKYLKPENRVVLKYLPKSAQ